MNTEQTLNKHANTTTVSGGGMILVPDPRIGTVGLPYPDTEAKIVDVDTGEVEMPTGEIGELCIRGPQVMKGYWNMPTETKNVESDRPPLGLFSYPAQTP